MICLKIVLLTMWRAKSWRPQVSIFCMSILCVDDDCGNQCEARRECVIIQGTMVMLAILVVAMMVIAVVWML